MTARANQGEPAKRETMHRMTRRRDGWDYRATGRYMATLTLADRGRPWLGRLEGEAIALSPLGRAVEAEWRAIPANWPGVEIEEYAIMPDHIHGIIRIVGRQSHPLGQIVGSFKAKTTAAARRLAGELGGELASKLGGKLASKLGGELASKLASTRPASLGCSQPGIVPASLLAGGSLWSPGFADSILYSAERRARAIAYIADNPRRLAAKRANPALFAVRRALAVPLPFGVACFDAIGSEDLLKAVDFHQIQCSRRFFAYRRDAYGNPLRDAPPAVETVEFRRASDLACEMAAAGAVLVNPCISQGEREIARRAFTAGAKMIVLRNKGFSPLCKPEGALFDRCAEGRLLMLAPAAWPYTPGRKPLTREDACALNFIAQAIAGDGAAEIDYKGVAPRRIEEIARSATTAAVARDIRR